MRFGSATARRSSARACCWPAGWSRPACGWCRSTGIRGPDEPSDNPCWDSHTGETKRLKEVLVPPVDAGVFGAARRPDRARPAGRDAGRLPGRVRPHAAVQQPRRPRPLGAGVFDRSGRRRHPRRHGLRRVGPHRRLSRDGLVRPEDITATIFHCLGFTPETEIHDAQGRPLAISRGQVLHQLLA